MLDEHSIIYEFLTDVDEYDSAWKGCFKDNLKINEFEERFSLAGIRYTTIRSWSKESDSASLKVNYSYKPLNLDVPFRSISAVDKECFFGKDRHKSSVIRSEEVNNDEEEPAAAKRRKMTTKKLGCSATLQYRHIEVFPDYQITPIDGLTSYRLRQLKKENLSALSRSLRFEPTKVRVERRTYVIISKAHCHSGHPVEESDHSSLPLDPRVTSFIQNLTRQGVTAVSEIKTRLDAYVEDVLFKDKDKPKKSSGAYYPSAKKISNHIYRAFQKSTACFDQESLDNVISRIRQEHPAAAVFCRYPKQTDINGGSHCAKSDTIRSDRVQSDSEKSDKQVPPEVAQFLFCYQSASMRDFMIRQARSLAMLEIVKSCTGYGFPVFFLLCRGDDNTLRCVGVFICYLNTVECVREALEVFREWCPLFEPSVWVSDCYESHIAALETTFPQSRVFISDLCRERSWKSWVKHHGKDRQILSYLGRLAQAETPEEFEKILETFKATELYANNKRLQQFLAELWIPLKEKWVSCYRKAFANVIIDADSPNRGVKYAFAEWSPEQKRVDGLIWFLVNLYLPQKFIHPTSCINDNKMEVVKNEITHQWVTSQSEMDNKSNCQQVQVVYNSNSAADNTVPQCGHIELVLQSAPTLNFNSDLNQNTPATDDILHSRSVNGLQQQNGHVKQNEATLAISVGGHDSNAQVLCNILVMQEPEANSATSTSTNDNMSQNSYEVSVVGSLVYDIPNSAPYEHIEECEQIRNVLLNELDVIKNEIRQCCDVSVLKELRSRTEFVKEVLNQRQVVSKSQEGLVPTGF